MPFPWRTQACVICGKSFRTQAPRGIYCSPECRAEGKRNAAKMYAAAMKAYHLKKQQQFIESRMANSRQCRGCVWKTPGQKYCVMPTCMLKALTKKEEDDVV